MFFFDQAACSRFIKILSAINTQILTYNRSICTVRLSILIRSPRFSLIQYYLTIRYVPTIFVCACIRRHNLHTTQNHQYAQQYRPNQPYLSLYSHHLYLLYFIRTP